MAQGRALCFVLAVGLAQGGCDQPNDWPLPTRRPSGTATAATGEAAPAIAAGCPDLVAGLWVARRFDGVKWYEHRLQLERQGSQLVCAQDSRSWLGAATDVTPPACPRGGRSYHLVYLRCEVAERPPVLDVHSLEIVSETHTCDAEYPGYNLDHFQGELAGNTWTTVNNDGGDDIDKPYRFRRLSCTP